jgi:hypothetical protein
MFGLSGNKLPNEQIKANLEIILQKDAQSTSDALKALDDGKSDKETIRQVAILLVKDIARSGDLVKISDAIDALEKYGILDYSDIPKIIDMRQVAKGLEKLAETYMRTGALLVSSADFLHIVEFFGISRKDLTDSLIQKVMELIAADTAGKLNLWNHPTVDELNGNRLLEPAKNMISALKPTTGRDGERLFKALLNKGLGEEQADRICYLLGFSH